MEITDIRVFPVDEEKLKAYVTIVIDGCFMVSDIKVINGNNGLFVSMPSKKRKNGTYRDVAHPLNSETRRMLEEKVLSKYEAVLAAGTLPRSVRRPREAPDPVEPEQRSAKAPEAPLPGGAATEGPRPEAPGR
ncbi:MAG: septation regulator SpoVG [Acidobacteria bacterium]|nr:MAG: septation regulator SpoVG [Acidobacteriota bacterium]